MEKNSFLRMTDNELGELVVCFCLQAKLGNDILCTENKKMARVQRGEKFMGLYLNPGNDGFKISVNSDIYVDKSGLLSYTNRVIGKQKRYLCVSRSRRLR